MTEVCELLLVTAAYMHCFTHVTRSHADEPSTNRYRVPKTAGRP